MGTRFPFYESRLIEASSLHAAAQQGEVEVVKKFIRNGISCDLRDEFDYTALMYAARMNHVEAIYYLIGLGADINLTDRVLIPVFAILLCS